MRNWIRYDPTACPVEKLRIRILTRFSDYEKAQKFASRESRTAAQKYYAADVHAMIDKHTSLQRKSEKAASQFVEETLLTVALAHEVRRHALIPFGSDEHVALWQYAVMILLWLREKSLTKELTNLQIVSDRKAM